MLRFVELGLGLTVVNGFCKLPRGLVACPLTELPKVSYFLIARAGGAQKGAAALLRQVLCDQVRAGGAVP